MEKPVNLRCLIEAIESESQRKSLSDGWLEAHGHSTREDVGIGEYAHGIVMVPEDWVLPYGGCIPAEAGSEKRTGESADYKGQAIPEAGTGYEPAVGGEILNYHIRSWVDSP